LIQVNTPVNNVVPEPVKSGVDANTSLEQALRDLDWGTIQLTISNPLISLPVVVNEVSKEFKDGQLAGSSEYWFVYGAYMVNLAVARRTRTQAECVSDVRRLGVRPTRNLRMNHIRYGYVKGGLGVKRHVTTSCNPFERKFPIIIPDALVLAQDWGLTQETESFVAELQLNNPDVPRIAECSICMARLFLDRKGLGRLVKVHAGDSHSNGRSRAAVWHCTG
jgi:hypothetical protein